MYSKVIFSLLVLYFSVVESNDIRIGNVSPRSRKIYGEIKKANPALWKRTDDIVIDAPYNEFIDAVYVTDLRKGKDGGAIIESGGIGQKSVTIGLKSPGILKGYKFQIEVYSRNPSDGYFSGGDHYFSGTRYAGKI